MLETAQSVKVQLLVSGKGTVYFDAPQLENNPYANAYNMLENGNFELGTGWTRNGAYYTSGTRFNMSRSMYINGNVEYNRYAYQEYLLNWEKYQDKKWQIDFMDLYQ